MWRLRPTATQRCATLVCSGIIIQVLQAAMPFPGGSLFPRYVSQVPRCINYVRIDQATGHQPSVCDMDHDVAMMQRHINTYETKQISNMHEYL